MLGYTFTKKNLQNIFTFENNINLFFNQSVTMKIYIKTESLELELLILTPYNQVTLFKIQSVTNG